MHKFIFADWLDTIDDPGFTIMDEVAILFPDLDQEGLDLPDHSQEDLESPNLTLNRVFTTSEQHDKISV